MEIITKQKFQSLIEKNFHEMEKILGIKMINSLNYADLINRSYNILKLFGLNLHWFII
jgi:hypothetical protein